MCFADEARPPIAPMAGASIAAARTHLMSEDGTRFVAFAASASTTPSEAAMIVLPDVRGLHPYYEELAVRFAEAGIDALAIDYFGRTARTDDRSEGFAYAEHVSRTAYPSLSADVEAAAAHLRAAGPRRLITIGFCFGGRLSLLTPTLPGVGVAGAIGFYGSPVGSNRIGMPAPADRAADNRAPVLAIFGGADEGIPPAAVASYEMALTAAGAEHEIVSYPGATHSFFDRRQADFADASADAWQRVLDFVASTGYRHT
jgi:carboxymethylenebutenolidase